MVKKKTNEIFKAVDGVFKGVKKVKVDLPDVNATIKKSGKTLSIKARKKGFFGL